MSVKLKGIQYIKGLYRFLETPWNTNPYIRSLSKDKEYMMGIDQSYTNTGIFIRSTDYEEFIMTEFPRRSLDKREFVSELRDFIYTLTEGLDIKLIVREVPVSNNFRYASSQLDQLAGKLDFIISEGEYTSRAKYKTIVNTSWKSQIVFKERSKNRARDKKLVAYDLIETFPVLSEMLKMTGKGYDSFDAAGILEGYIFKKYGKGNSITGEVSMASMIAFAIPYKDNKEIKGVIPQKFSKNFTVKNYNSELTLHDNVKRCPSSMSTLIVVNDMRGELSIKWRLKNNTEDNIVLFVTKKSNVDNYDMAHFINNNIESFFF